MLGVGRGGALLSCPRFLREPGARVWFAASSQDTLWWRGQAGAFRPSGSRKTPGKGWTRRPWRSFPPLWILVFDFTPRSRRPGVNKPGGSRKGGSLCPRFRYGTGEEEEEEEAVLRNPQPEEPQLCLLRPPKGGH